MGTWREGDREQKRRGQEPGEKGTGNRRERDRNGTRRYGDREQEV